MSEALTTAELEAQIEVRKTRFKQVIHDIRMVLEEDLPLFVVRETKRAFLGHTEAAAALGKERVRALKQEATALGASVTREISDALADEALWHASTAVPANTRDIASATAVWEVVRRVEKAVHALLGGYGLADAEPVAYKAPAYFVKGLYLPGLAEHYWRLIHEVQELAEQQRRIVADATKAELEAVWDEA